jgi:hypothetical protein
MKAKYAYIKWDCEYTIRKQVETIQDLSLSLKFKDYEFLSQKAGLSQGYLKLIFSNKVVPSPKHLSLLKQAVKQQLLRDVYILS